MKQLSILLICALFFGSCSSYQSFSGAVAGGSLGGMFGSAIGGIIGGHRGADAGTAIGVLAGAAIGSQAAKGKSERTTPSTPYDYGRNDDLEYGRIERPSNTAYQWQNLEVSDIRFFDTNDNRALDAGEQAYIEMNIYNNGNVPLYDLVPTIKSDNKRIRISPSAIIAKIEPGRGVLYRAAVIATDRLRSGNAVFSVFIGNNATPLKQFRVHTKKR